MIFSKKYRYLLKKRVSTPDEIMTFNEPFIKETVQLFSDHITEAVDFLKHDCTEDEYSWISEIIENIAEESKSIKLIQAYRDLANKYPEETKKYNIDSFINSALSIAESWQDEDN